MYRIIGTIQAVLNVYSLTAFDMVLEAFNILFIAKSLVFLNAFFTYLYFFYPTNLRS